MVQTFHEILAAGRDGLTQYFRIGQYKITWRQRIDVLAGIEVDLFRSLTVEPVDACNCAVQMLGRGKIRLFDVIVDKVVLPVVVLEPSVAFSGFNDRASRLAK